MKRSTAPLARIGLVLALPVAAFALLSTASCGGVCTDGGLCCECESSEDCNEGLSCEVFTISIEGGRLPTQRCSRVETIEPFEAPTSAPAASECEDINGE